jgi:hypothetical protein
MEVTVHSIPLQLVFPPVPRFLIPVSVVGFEPSVLGLRVECRTTVLPGETQ